MNSFSVLSSSIQQSNNKIKLSNKAHSLQQQQMMLSPTTIQFSMADDDLKPEKSGKNILEYVTVFIILLNSFLKINLI